MGEVGGGKSMRDRKQDSKSGSKLGEIMRKICNIKELMFSIICFTLRFRTCLLEQPENNPSNVHKQFQRMETPSLAVN